MTATELWWALGWALGGLLCGSFLNVVIHRWPLMLSADHDLPATHSPGAAPSTLADSFIPKAMPGSRARFDLAYPRSHCPHCHTPLGVTELIPLFSFAWLRGRCRHCQHPIAWRYPAVELLNMVWWLGCGLTVPAWLGPMPVTVLNGWLPGAALWGPSLAWALWGSTLLALAWIDWDSTWLPDGLTQPLAWGGLIAAAVGWSGLSLPQALGGAVAGYLALWSVATLYRWIAGQEGMGEGDFKLLAALGAWLGPMLLIPLALIASMLGLLAGLVLHARGQLREGRYIPFGPFLIVAALALRLGLDRPLLALWGVS